VSDVFIAIVLGVIEGLTEFLPVSSTGHMILAGALLNFSGERAETFEIVIQLGAIVAVAGLYRARFAELVKPRHWLPPSWLPPRWHSADDPAAPMLTLAHVALACIPAFVLGAAFHGVIKRNLFTEQTVLIGLIAGGALMIIAEFISGRRHEPPTTSLDAITPVQAGIAGAVQCLALWPGFSRSGSMIAGGMLARLDRRTAADFSFLVAVPVMLAATGFDLVKSWHLVTLAFAEVVAVGFVVAFAVAWLAVAAFLRVLGTIGLTPFAMYRFVLAAVYALIVLR